MFPSPDNDQSNKQKMLAWVIIAIGLVVLVAFGVFYAIESGGLTAPMVIAMAIAIIAAITTPLIAMNANKQKRQQGTTAKAKRGLDGTDMYTLIDRMVDDLDDDEATYLRRRLDDHERGLQRDSTKNALADLLNERDDASREGWR